MSRILILFLLVHNVFLTSDIKKVVDPISEHNVLNTLPQPETTSRIEHRTSSSHSTSHLESASEPIIPEEDVFSFPTTESLVEHTLISSGHSGSQSLSTANLKGINEGNHQKFTHHEISSTDSVSHQHGTSHALSTADSKTTTIHGHQPTISKTIQHEVISKSASSHRPTTTFIEEQHKVTYIDPHTTSVLSHQLPIDETIVEKKLISSAPHLEEQTATSVGSHKEVIAAGTLSHSKTFASTPTATDHKHLIEETNMESHRHPQTTPTKKLTPVDVVNEKFPSTDTVSSSVANHHDNHEKHPSLDTALYLTKYLENGQYQLAQELSRVHLNCVSNSCASVQSYSGYVTVNKKYDSNIHLWYFPAEKNPETAPVIFFFPAGPSFSIMFLVFMIGPFRLNNQNQLEYRPSTWTKHYNILFVENPVESGFSYTRSAQGIVGSAASFTSDLYEVYKQFYQWFPRLKKNNLYFVSHSYGGRYNARLAEKILQEKHRTNDKVNFLGSVYIGPFIDAFHQINYGSFLHDLGLVGPKGLRELNALQNELKRAINAGNHVESFELYGKLIYIPDLKGRLVGNLTGYQSAYNILHGRYNYTLENNIIKFVTQPHIRRAIHVDQKQRFLLENPAAIQASGIDATQSSIPAILHALKSNVTVVICNGMFDMYTPYDLASNVINHIHEYGALYEEAPRHKWYMHGNACTSEMIEQWHSVCDDHLAGYITEVEKYGKLAHVLVRGGGHLVAAEQTIRMQALLNKYIR